MKHFAQFLRGVLLALVSVFLVMGALATSMVESSSIPESLQLTSISSSETPIVVLPTPIVIVTSTPSIPVLPTNTPIPSNTNCPHPAGWSPIYVRAEDTLSSLANTYHTTPYYLTRANCLQGFSLVPGTILYVPFSTTEGTITEIPTIACGPPAGWISYRVKAEDNLYQISQSYNVGISELQNANCMGSSTLLRVGQIIYVPNVKTKTPSPTNTTEPTQTPPETITNTFIPSLTSTHTPTFTQIILTSTHTSTLSPPTETPIPPTNTATSTSTETQIAVTNTPGP